MAYRAMAPDVRFFRHVEAAGECWLWTAHLNPCNGYGRFWTKDGTRPAHRWSYEYFVAEVPTGLQLDHLCRNRRCVNPYHLEPVTPQVNTLRGDTPAARNAAKTTCLRGHPLDQRNTYICPRGKRECRTCRLAATRASQARRRARRD